MSCLVKALPCTMLCRESDDKENMSTFRSTIHGVAAGALRRLLDLTETEAAAAAGTSRKVLSQLESGTTKRRLPERLRELGRALGYRAAHLQLVVRSLALALAGREETKRGTAIADGTTEVLRAATSQEAGLAATIAVDESLLAIRARRDERRDRRQAAHLCERLLVLSEARQALVIQVQQAFWTWAAVDWLCEASVRVAGSKPAEALRLAQLAVNAAERCVRTEWRARVEGYAGFFVANALRVASRLHEAEAASSRAWSLWHEPLACAPPLLPEWRPLDLTTSLRRDEGRWAEALDCANRSLALAPASAHSRLLVKKATLTMQMGDYESAVEALKAASPYIVHSAEPRLVLALRFNFAFSLERLGKAGEAEPHLDAARAIAQALSSSIDMNRCLWLGGLLAAHQGRRKEGLACLLQARREFTHLEMALDAAAVALDEAILHLEAKETERVRALASESAWIFGASGIPREAFTALVIFREAVERDAATVALVAEVRERLRQAMTLTATNSHAASGRALSPGGLSASA